MHESIMSCYNALALLSTINNEVRYHAATMEKVNILPKPQFRHTNAHVIVMH